MNHGTIVRNDIIYSGEQDKVSYTSDYEKGARIGTLTINGVDNDILCPSEVSEVSLSTEGHTDEVIKFGIEDGKYGYYIESEGADTFYPFKQKEVVTPAGSVLSFGMTRCFGNTVRGITIAQSYNSDYIETNDNITIVFLKDCKIKFRVLTSGNASYTSGYTIYKNNEVFKTITHSVWTYDEFYTIDIKAGDTMGMTAFAHPSWDRDYSCCISLIS